jgi:hypothetical protein
MGKVIGFTTRIINPDRLIDKFTVKKACLKTRLLMKEPTNCCQNKMPLGILIDKEFQDIVLIPIFKSDDSF